MIQNAVSEVRNNLRKGQLIVLESTTYPGTTDEILTASFESKGFKVGKDVFVAFSPERIDPGNKTYKFYNTPKVVGGTTPACTRLTTALYKTLVSKVVLVKDTRTAEMSKLLENIFRNINIALVNELMMVCDRMGLDIWEIIDAASTKPFGFMPFYPGPGVGGHCIPVDPFYLSWKAREFDVFVNFISMSAQTNENVPYYVVAKILKLLIKLNMKPKDIKLLLLGMSFKPNIDDCRNSPSMKIFDLLTNHHLRLNYHDPFFPNVTINGKRYKSVKDAVSAAKKHDVVVILTPHSCYDIEAIIKTGKLIIDTRNATSRFIKQHKNIVRI